MEVHPNKATNCLKYNLILLAVVVVDKTRKRVCISATLIAILSVIFSRPLILCKASSIWEGRVPFRIWILLFLLDSDSAIPFAFWKDVTPLIFKWLK